MNLDIVEAVHLTQQLAVLLSAHPVDHVDVVLAPPFVDIRSVISVLESERLRVSVGAQHVSQFDNGAYTGEISVSMLKRMGVTHVVTGHSERREHFAMTDDVVRATLLAVVQGELHAVLCVGEGRDVRDEGDEARYVADQLRSALGGLAPKYHDQVVVAYEPLWVIGSGTSAATEQIAAMSHVVRRTLVDLGLGDRPVLYGGSVSADNAGAILREGGVDGFLVGGASRKGESFHAILAATNDCYAGGR